MRLLVIAPQVPWPLTQGTAIRNYHVARRLAERHDVTLLAFGADGGRADPLVDAGIDVRPVPAPAPRTFARRLADLFTTRTPDLARRLDVPGMHAALAATLAAGDFDVVQVEGLEMACYPLAGLGAARRRPRLVYDAHNAEWVLQRRAWQADLGRPRRWHGAVYSLLQEARLRRFERRLLAAADATVAVSEADAAALAEVAPGAVVTVVPNGVDLEHYRPGDPADAEPGLCVFTGKMDFRPNVDAVVWLCEKVWPLVLASRPGARLSIVGRDPVARVRRLAGPGVEVTGAVDDVRPHLSRASVVVVPLRVGGGTRLKVLEAMAMARPITATPLAVEGLHVEDGVEALLAERPAELAGAVVRLLDSPALGADLGRRARRRVEAEYGWDALVPRIEARYAATGSEAEGAADRAARPAATGARRPEDA